MMVEDDDEGRSNLSQSDTDNSDRKAKGIAFIVIGGMTMLYCVLELGAALRLNSLVLLSDGFHNLSDVVSLYIAYLAQNAAQRQPTDIMTYGWARSEVLGGLTNGCFLLSLCLYIILEAIPKVIRPEEPEGGVIFILVAAIGLVLNTVGTIVFAKVGLAHGHSHGHSHGHGHAHHGIASSKHSSDYPNSPSSDPLISHNDGDGDEDEDDGHHEDSHHTHNHHHNHSHSHHHDDDHYHQHNSHSNSEHTAEMDHLSKSPISITISSSHDHQHHHRSSKHHSKPAKDKGIFSRMDVNTFGVFIHYLGDAVSSLFVLITGIFIHYSSGSWTFYIDPISSVLIVALIIFTTIPLVKKCSLILLQRVPDDIDISSLRFQLSSVKGVVGVKNLHVWQLVDSMTISSCHLIIHHHSNISQILREASEIFKEAGIQSSSIQPELVDSTYISSSSSSTTTLSHVTNP
eukprot:TRINITY_DN20154_c0_g1_i1.p1 TRINITY_DN20154_c0_g1~~TRINITY_DN20154_c0_g1_i1.p1  ORF type:complete len:458 (+),score=98.46 TRINITY_DN20154_c0_g1_i1:134-1507(+)